MSRYPPSSNVTAHAGMDNHHSQYAWTVSAAGALWTGEWNRSSTQSACSMGGTITAVVDFRNRGNGEAYRARPMRYVPKFIPNTRCTGVAGLKANRIVRSSAGAVGTTPQRR